jgi:hypothetical protein
MVLPSKATRLSSHIGGNILSPDHKVYTHVIFLLYADQTASLRKQHKTIIKMISQIILFSQPRSGSKSLLAEGMPVKSTRLI